MKKLNVRKAMKVMSNGVTKHAPGILTGIGIAGMLTTVVLAVKATPKAVEMIQEAEEEGRVELEKSEKYDDEHIAALEKEVKKPINVVRVAWKPYIPAAVTGIASTICLIGACSVNARRNAALATAYQISQTALSEYRDKVVETIGEKKEQNIREAIAKDKVEENPVSKKEVIITGNGDTLCYDLHAARYFKSDIEKIRKAENRLNKKLITEMYVSLNDFYYELGMRGSKLGDDLGWNLDSGLIEIYFSSQLSDEGQPCLTIDYNIAPRYDYAKLL